MQFQFFIFDAACDISDHHHAYFLTLIVNNLTFDSNYSWLI